MTYWLVTLLVIGSAAPAAAQQPLLRLPFSETGWAHVCTQGPGGARSHSADNTRHDLDFDTPNSGQEADPNPEPILAAADGTAYACPCPPAGCPHTGFGNNVRVAHGTNLFTIYGHLASASVSNGTFVVQGQTIGLENNTGNSDGDHVHFGLHEGDPADCASAGTSIEIETLEVIDRTDRSGPSTLRSSDFKCGDPGGSSHRYLSTNPRPTVITSALATDGLTITAPAGFVLGEPLIARFRFQNRSSVPITLRNIVVGGRLALNGVSNCANYGEVCPDFPVDQGPRTLAPYNPANPNDPATIYDYAAGFTPQKAGHYEFDIFWRIPDDPLNTEYGWMFGPPVDPSSLFNQRDIDILGLCTAGLAARGGCVEPTFTSTPLPSGTFTRTRTQTALPTLISPIATPTRTRTPTLPSSPTQRSATATPPPTTTPTTPSSVCPDDGNPCTDEVLSNGVCTHPVLPDLRDCNDGFFCNGRDLCHEGTCGGPGFNTGNPCGASDGDSDCSEACDEATDTCTAPDPDGVGCNDNVFCNGQDICNGGECGTHLGDPCTQLGERCNEELRQCDPFIGPTHTPTSSLPVRTPTVPLCIGDCTSDESVTIDELVTGVRLLLGIGALQPCSQFGCDNVVTLSCIEGAVASALAGGCSGVVITPVPTTSTPTANTTPPPNPTPADTPPPSLMVKSIHFCTSVTNAGTCNNEVPADHSFAVDEKISVLIWYEIANGPAVFQFTNRIINPDGGEDWKNTHEHQAGLGASTAPNWAADVQLWKKGVFEVRFAVRLISDSADTPTATAQIFVGG